MILCEIKIADKICTFVNIYAPNQDQPNFFVELVKLLEHASENKIVIGDFNLVLDLKMDRLNSTYNNNNSMNIMKQAMEEMMLVEVWRLQNPNIKRYSWFAKGLKKASHIDYAIVDQGIIDQVVNCDYFTGLHTDHSAFIIVLDIVKHQRGRGYWKFNTSHLRIREFHDVMNKEIDENMELYRELDSKRRWELLKFNMANCAQTFARERASQTQLIISPLSEKITELEEKVSSIPDHRSVQILEQS